MDRAKREKDEGTTENAWRRQRRIIKGGRESRITVIKTKRVSCTGSAP